jgi:hypothetical protein
MDAISKNAVNLGSLLSNVKAPLKRFKPVMPMLCLRWLACRCRNQCARV